MQKKGVVVDIWEHIHFNSTASILVIFRLRLIKCIPLAITVSLFSVLTHKENRAPKHPPGETPVLKPSLFPDLEAFAG